MVSITGPQSNETASEIALSAFIDNRHIDRTTGIEAKAARHPRNPAKRIDEASAMPGYACRSDESSVSSSITDNLPGRRGRMKP